MILWAQQSWGATEDTVINTACYVWEINPKLFSDVEPKIAGCTPDKNH